MDNENVPNHTGVLNSIQNINLIEKILTFMRLTILTSYFYRNSLNNNHLRVKRNIISILIPFEASPQAFRIKLTKV